MLAGRRTLVTFGLGLTVGAALCAVVIGYAVRYARASGIPTTNALSYSGSLLTFGQPDNSSHSMTAALYIGGVQACTPSMATVTCVNGQFTIALDPSCTPIVENNTNVDVELSVDGTAMGMQPLTAVPYAVEAGGMSASGLTGVLAVTNGGTGSSTENFVDLTTTQTIGGAKTHTGPTALEGTTTIPSGSTLAINGTPTFNGLDLFTYSMQGTYPAVTPGQAWTCGAPGSLNLATSNTAGYAPVWGPIIYTNEGAFGMNVSQPYASPCNNECYGPLTYFLSSPSSQTIQLSTYTDDGPSYIYLNGTVVATLGGSPATTSVNIPSGSFALSLEACSSNGPSIGFYITNTFITQYGLTVNYNQTFHRNGN